MNKSSHESYWNSTELKNKIKRTRMTFYASVFSLY